MASKNLGGKLRRIIPLAVTATLFACASATVFSACFLFGDPADDGGKDTHVHNLTHTQKNEPTCTEDGNPEYWYCPDCGNYYSDAEATAELGKTAPVTAARHDLTHVYYLFPTCVDEGHKTYYECEVCGLTFWNEDGTEQMTPDEATIPPTGEHTWNDNVCYYCHTDAGGSKGLEWMHGEGGYTLTGVGRFTGGELIIPEVYNGEPVIGIGDNAFENCSSVTGVIIPDSVTEIGSCAFLNCANLTEITLGTGVTDILNNAFYGCYGLKKVNIKDMAAWCNITFESYANPKAIAGSVTYLNGKIISGEYTFPAGITVIPQDTLTNNPVTGITVPDSVTRIESYAFSDCNDLVKIELPFLVKEKTAFQNYTINPKSILGTSASAVREVVVTGGHAVPDEAFYGFTSLTSVTLPETIKSIGKNAFRGCNGLTEFTLPNGLTAIGEGIFYGCGFESVIIPDGITSVSANAYANCKSLTSLTVGEGVTAVGDGAFAGCDNLQTVNWNATNCNTAGSNTNGIFKDCPSLTTVNFGARVEKIPPYMLYGCGSVTALLLENTAVTGVGNYAFYGCSGVTEITLPEGLKSIGDYAFRSCSIVTELTLPDGLESMGVYAFYGCTRLKSIRIPNGVTRLKEYAFGLCTSLESVTFTDSLSQIDQNALASCTALTGVTIPAGLQIIAGKAFYNCANLKTVYWNATDCEKADSDNNAVFEGCAKLDTVVIGEGVTTLPDYAFAGLAALTEITLPQGLTTIKAGVFKGTGLQRAELPESVTRIGAEAFYGCTALASVNIPDGVKAVLGSAFYGCIALSEVTVPSGITDMGTSVFYGCTGLQSVTLYSDAGASMFENCTGLKNLDLTDITAIKARAFAGCTSLVSVTIPKRVNYIYDGAFAGCTALKTVNWNSRNCLTAGSKQSPVFENCPAFTTLVFSDEVEGIPEYAFYKCENLVGVLIAINIRQIGKHAFDCSRNSITFSIVDGWKVTKEFLGDDAISLPGNNATLAQYLTYDYQDYYWSR